MYGAELERTYLTLKKMHWWFKRNWKEVFRPECCLATGGERIPKYFEVNLICGGMEPPIWQNTIAQVLRVIDTTHAMRSMQAML